MRAHTRAHTHSLPLTEKHIQTRDPAKKETSPFQHPRFEGKNQMAKVALLPDSPCLALGSAVPSADATAGWGSLSAPEYLSQPVDVLRGC